MTAETYFAERKVSQSLLARMDVCPHSALLYARHREDESPSHAMARGTAFHAFAEAAIKQMLKDGEVTMPPDVARELMESICDERLDLVIPHHERDALRAMAWNYAQGTEINPANPPQLEVDLEMELAGWTLRGRIDRVDIVAERDCYLRDYKTSLSTRSQEDFEASFQTYFYALLIAENNPKIDTFHLAEEYPRFISKRCTACGTYNDGEVDLCKECKEGIFEAPDLFRRRLTIGKRELHDFKRSITTLLARLGQSVEDGHWPASPGSHCNTCPCQPECPLPRVQRPVQITDAEEARNAARDLDRLEADQKRLKASLREWCKEEGEIRYGDVSWEFNAVISNTVDKQAMAQALREGGGDPDAFTKSSTSTRFTKRKAA